MPRPLPEGRTSRARPRSAEGRIFIRRPALAEETDTSEGWWRWLEKNCLGPKVIRVGRVCLYDREEALAWLRRHATDPATTGPQRCAAAAGR
ncbi:MAG: hypothetical protein ACYDBY_14895 [Thermoanaerobaculia bacterium]|jgi:hypothetical protein